MEEYSDKYNIDGFKSNRTRDKYEKNKVRKNKLDKESPIHNHRYITTQIILTFY